MVEYGSKADLPTKVMHTEDSGEAFVVMAFRDVARPQSQIFKRPFRLSGRRFSMIRWAALPPAAPVVAMGHLATLPSHRLQMLGVDVLKHVEDAQLMPGIRPQFSKQGQIEGRAV